MEKPGSRLPTPAVLRSELDSAYLHIRVLGLPYKISHTEGVNTRNVLSQGSRGWKYETEVRQEWFLRGCGENLSLALVASGGLLASLVTLDSWQHNSNLHFTSSLSLFHPKVTFLEVHSHMGLGPTLVTSA